MRNYELNEEMHNRRANVINKLTKIVHPIYIEEFSKILHYSWQENLPEAENIAQNLDLYPIDFCALARDEEEFSILFMKELEDNYLEDYA